MRRATRIITQDKGSQVLRSRWYAQKQSTICLLCQQRARTCAAPFSSTASQKLRKRPTRAPKTSELIEEGPMENATEELVLGGERSRKEIEADAREYETRRRNEEREAFQKRVDDAAEQYYVKASNWDGMEMVGGEKEWPYGDRQRFQGYLPAPKTTNIRDIKIAIHRATIEVYLARLFKRSARTLPSVNQEDLADSETSLVEMKPSVDGNKVELRFPNEDVRGSVINSVAPPNERLSRASVTVDDAQDPSANEAAILEEKAQIPEAAIGAEQLSGKAAEETPDAAASPSSESSLRIVDFNKEWGSVPISHPAVKLAIVRRIAHFTGHVFPDPVIQSASTVSDLSQYLVKKLSKPNKLYEELVGRAPAEESKTLLEELLGTDSVTEVRGNALLNLAHVPGEKKRPLVGLPNVVVSGQRVTPIDKEKAVGRWKMIEAELEKRRLPVIGRS